MGGYYIIYEQIQIHDTSYFFVSMMVDIDLPVDWVQCWLPAHIAILSTLFDVKCVNMPLKYDLLQLNFTTTPAISLQGQVSTF